MALQRARNAAAFNMNLSMIKEGIHWNKTLEPAVKEKLFFRRDDPEERNSEHSKAAIKDMSLSRATQRDIGIDYHNPREQLSMYSYGVDQIPPFDQGTVDLMRPWDFELKQQVNQVILGRSNYVIEENKYDQTVETEGERIKAAQSKAFQPAGKPPQPDVGVTPSMANELAFHSLMETTSTL